MKNTAINNLTYTGIVTLSRYNGKTKTFLNRIKNSGGVSLFNFLSSCLIGDFNLAALSRPTQIMLLKKSDDTTYRSVSGFIPLLSKPEKIFDREHSIGSTICYSFIVPREYLEADFDSIGLYPQSATLSEADVNSYSAICEVSSSESIQLSASTVLVVDWELIITNQAGDTTGNVSK